MFIDDGFNDNISLDQVRQSLPPPPVRKQPQASILQDHLEKLMQANAASEIPPPEKKTQHQEPQGKAPAAPGEQAQKPASRVITATCLRQVTYARHLHAIMEPYVGDCGKHPAFMEIMGQIFLEYGSPDDPLAKMAIQQMVFFHELIPVLHRRAIESPSIEVADVFYAAAHRAAEDYRKVAAQFLEILRGLAKRTRAKAQPKVDSTVNKPVMMKHPKKSTRKKTG